MMKGNNRKGRARKVAHFFWCKFTNIVNSQYEICYNKGEFIWM